MKEIILAIRFLLEICSLIALGYWGYYLGKGVGMKIFLLIFMPVMMMLLWGMFISPKASIHIPEWLRLILELLLFGIAAFGLYNSGLLLLSGIFLVLVILQRILLTVLGN
ncbi:YrdB family protein [Bacillus alveayuensis]|uniref:YrdB family protein n=1 Tax=Aeribacillus alveayuensis TaxID=279215 RepID=UPI000697C146|nr:YrdB family protein [Bacillus alveayuensis]